MLSAGGLTFRRRCSYGSQETGEPHRRFSATVQTMACFKCQKPEPAAAPRHRILRPEADNGLLSNAACGDGLYAPFPVSTSATAAALGLELVLSWNSGNPGLQVQDASPGPEAQLSGQAHEPHALGRVSRMPTSAVMIFRTGLRLVAVADEVVEKISAFSRRPENSREAGGILVGSYREPHIQVASCSGPWPVTGAEPRFLIAAIRVIRNSPSKTGAIAHRRRRLWASGIPILNPSRPRHASTFKRGGMSLETTQRETPSS
jgi:hypothetical protein